MHRSAVVKTLIVTSFCFVFSTRLLAVPPDGEKLAPAFGLNHLLKIEIEMTPEEYRAMQPSPPAGMPGSPAQAAPPRKRGDRDIERNLFGVEFPWAQGTLKSGGLTLEKAALRYAGNASYLASAFGLKRSLYVELDGATKSDLHSLRSLAFQSGALDATKSREALAFELFRKAGVPAPRTALAEVTLTVPGERNKALLGVYTLVEPFDASFLKNHFGVDKGLLLRPQGLRGLDYLGDDWSKYRANYRPAVEPSSENAQRFIAFVKLVQQAGDEQFQKEIGQYLDVDRFLRFMAMQSFLANADGFFTLAYNYAIVLDPKIGRFVFIPGDQELSFANFLMMGSAEQLMDMSIDHPYGGQNRLADRLLAIPSVRDTQKKILKELAATVFVKERLLEQITALERTTKPILERELAARAERGEPPAGFGPPGTPSAPDLRTFVEKRLASIADQLAGKKSGYRPQFNFAPPRANLPPTPIDDRTIGDVVKAPEGFKVSLFAAPPKVGYPVAISVAPDGAVFVAVDEQGSLGRTAGGGRVVRCIDENGDGKADRVSIFARMEHPRGVIAQDGEVWVLHPPILSRYEDDDGDGVADHEETLVTGLTTRLLDERGGDHTTNGIRMGVDGWIYIAVGDYGFHKATGKDGTTISQRGGGILRVRPDGTGLEVFATGLRNPFAVAIDPFMNIFTRDNTNDGAGWDERVSHILQTADYGYPLRFTRFTDEIMTPLRAYGQGGGTGALFIQDDRWPQAYRGALLTGDWGRNEVYRHELTPSGASFRASSDVFLTMPRPTGMDMGPDGRLYVASWRGGEASVHVGPDVGFIACITPPGWKSSPHRDFEQMTLGELTTALCSKRAVESFDAQREIIRRGGSPRLTMTLSRLAADPTRPLNGRVAAMLALKQLNGTRSHELMRRLLWDDTIREFALRALAGRKNQLGGLESDLFIRALSDRSPRVRAQALIALGRLGRADVASQIIPLTDLESLQSKPSNVPTHAQADPNRAIPHLSYRTLVELHAVEACVDAIDGPHRAGALRALKSMYDAAAVEGLIKKLGSMRDANARRDVLATLVRLYHKEAEYDGSWWGIRPDTAGPYYDPREWECSKRIATVLQAALQDGDVETKQFLRDQLALHRVRLPGISADTKVNVHAAEDEPRVVLAKADPKNPNQIGNMTYEAVAQAVLNTKGNADRGKTVFTTQSCRACHTDADGQMPKGPHLVDIGKRYSYGELVESILKPNTKIAQGYEAYNFAMSDGRVFSGFVVSEGPASVQIRDASGSLRELKRSEIDQRRRNETSTMPEGLAATLSAEQFADLVAYLQSLAPTK